MSNDIVEQSIAYVMECYGADRLSAMFALDRYQKTIHADVQTCLARIKANDPQWVEAVVGNWLDDMVILYGTQILKDGAR